MGDSKHEGAGYRACLGPGAGARRGRNKPHEFWSTGPGNRVCKNCAAIIAKLTAHSSARMVERMSPDPRVEHERRDEDA